MFTGKLVFAQLMDFLPAASPFAVALRVIHQPIRPKRFRHLDQYLCMAFAQLTFRESLTRHRSLFAGAMTQNSITSAFAGMSRAAIWLMPTRIATGGSIVILPTL